MAIQSPVTKKVVAAIEQVVRQEMRPFGISSVRVSSAEDHDGDPILMVDAEYAADGQPVDLTVAAGLVTKLAGCEVSHQLNALAIDAMGELGVLYEGSPHERDRGRWQSQYMFTLGLIIGGGTAQIQKNIIAERGLGMPREPRPAAKE